MSEPRTFATLTPKLLASKGAARPAMRKPDSARGGRFAHLQPSTVGREPLDDLGWNDWGHGAPETPLPEVLLQIQQLADRLSGVCAPAQAARGEGRRAAFTLRLDADRHFRLKMAGLLLDRSAQVIVTEALDKYLSEVPGMSSHDGSA